MGKLDDAEAHLNEAARKSPKDPTIFRYLNLIRKARRRKLRKGNPKAPIRVEFVNHRIRATVECRPPLADPLWEGGDTPRPAFIPGATTGLQFGVRWSLIYCT